MSQENRKMSSRQVVRTTLSTVAVMLAVLLPAATAGAEPAPWWQILTGSRPSNIWKPTDSVQEIKTRIGKFIPNPAEPNIFLEAAAARVDVGGKPVACLGTVDFVGETLCGAFYGGFPVTNTAAQLQAALEPAFGVPVEVTGGPVGGEPFKVTVKGRSAPPITFFQLPDFSGVGSFESRILSDGGSGRLVVSFTNIGDLAVDATAIPVTIEDELPAGVIATDVVGVYGNNQHFDCALDSQTHVTCNFEETLPRYEALEIEVFVNLVGEEPAAGEAGKVTITGGNAAGRGVPQELVVSPEPTPSGIERFSSRVEAEGGGPVSQAGSHPFQLTTTIQAKSGVATGRQAERRVEQGALVRNLRFPLPAGLVGNVAAAPRCSMTAFLARRNDIANQCPDASAVGMVNLAIVEPRSLGYLRMAFPFFNLTPGFGEPARFGFVVLGNPVVIDTAVDPDDEYKIVASARNTTQLIDFLSSTLVLWGSPGDRRHDSARGWGCGFNLIEVGTCERPPSLPEQALLRQPVSCVTPLDFRAEVEFWNAPPGVFDAAGESHGTLSGCNKIPFDPGIEAEPTSKLAENPTGLDFRLDMPNSGLLNPGAIAEGQAKKVEVTLPEGMTINPSQAEGLAVCSPDEYAKERFDSFPGEGCPDASKVGEVRISTPLLEEEARGSLYVAKPYDNPGGSLIGLYMVAKIPERGVLIKQFGKVTPDPKTGQLVTTFDDLPQLPFSTFKLHFREGGRAPLVTPPSCGTSEVVARFTPWSASDPNNPQPNEVVTRTSPFTIERGVDGGGCPSGAPQFKPGFEAGSINPAAGRFSPFYMRLTRKDGDQDLTKFSSILPEGALAKLAGLTQCPQAAVEGAKGRKGLDEKASPSCPSSSRIGRTNVGAGVGSILTYVPGELYLGGPYHGARLSVVSITPAVAGPFDLGTVVVQEALRLDPATSEVHVDGNASDPIPHILQGIPLKVRDLRVYVDRDKFTTTPTSCDPMATKATLFGSGADVFNPGDDVAADLSARYQAASCEALGFKPRLKFQLSARRSTRGAHPALRAVLRPRLGDANPDRISVTLPGSELLEQSHIRTICTRVQFAAKGGFGGGCPAASVYGHVKAWTPLLDGPLEGPVYLRSSNHELPDLVLALHGLVDIESVGRIDSVNARIRTTFENVPDAPLSKVVLSMQGGRKGLLVNSTDICRGKHRAKARLTGQNGKLHEAKPKVKANCKGNKRPKRR
jgi:hypothetical protein